jgi:hypothetical protein
MIRLRLLVWLLTLVALIAPPGISVHAMASAPQAMSVDCADHGPPPDPCPSEGTAKHAASACCPLMSGAVALLPLPASVDALSFLDITVASGGRPLSGRIFTKDPPPPRV